MAEKDKQAGRVLSEFEAIRLEKEQLELEEMRFRVADMKQKKAVSESKTKRTEAELQSTIANEKRKQASCNHRKGGFNVEGLISGQGEDSKYAVNKHTYPNKITVVMCTRCFREWKPGDPQYDEARMWPTDNQPSASVTFDNTYATA